MVVANSKAFVFLTTTHFSSHNQSNFSFPKAFLLSLDIIRKKLQLSISRCKIVKLKLDSQILTETCAYDPFDRSDVKISHNALLCHQKKASRALRPSPFASLLSPHDFLLVFFLCVCEVGTVGKISDCQPEGPGFNPRPGRGLNFGRPSFATPSVDRDVKPLV